LWLGAMRRLSKKEKERETQRETEKQKSPLTDCTIKEMKRYVCMDNA